MQRITFKVGAIRVISYAVTLESGGNMHCYYLDTTNKFTPGKMRLGGSLANVIGDGLMVHGIRTIGHA